MFTLEQKVDLILRYIATADKGKQNELKKAILEALHSGETPVPAPAPVIPDVEDLVVDMLKDIGMPQHVKGYYYTVSAIELCVAKHEYLDAITKELYPVIAEKYSTTPSRVERAIRHAIEICFERTDIRVLASIFGNTPGIKNGKLTNSEFIAFCANDILRKLKRLEAAK